VVSCPAELDDAEGFGSSTSLEKAVRYPAGK